ncbi:MAG: hypothetical protein WBG69_08975 [Arcobacteraceae bacterium]
MIQIHDIKPIVKIPDFSIYLYYGAIVVSILLLFMIIYFLFKFFKPKAKSIEYEYYQKLQNLDLLNIKQSAYDISKYGKLLAKDERAKRLIDEIDDLLEPYKYKKDIPTQFSTQIQTKFKIFMESVDV